MILIVFFLNLFNGWSSTDPSEATMYRKAYDVIKHDPTTIKYLSEQNSLDDSIYVANQTIDIIFHGVLCEYIQRNYQLAKPCGIIVTQYSKLVYHVSDSLERSVIRPKGRFVPKPLQIDGFSSNQERGNILVFSRIENNGLYAEMKTFTGSYRELWYGRSIVFYITFDNAGNITNIYHGDHHNN